MNHVTSIGLDVHARSVTAVALDSITGEVRSQKFGYSPAEIAGWILQLDSPKAVYESGVTGFHLVRELREMGVDCIVGAVSKMHKPASDRRKKNDRNDAEFLARQLMAHNIVEVFVPDVETEGARNLSRALEDIRDDLTRAKHRLTHLLIRWGYIWNEFNEDGKRRGSWTHAHWEWIRGIELPDAAARESLDYYISEVRHIESQKKAIEKRVAQCASRPRWRDRVEALRCMKGIETVTAFALTVEAGVFSRFDSARAFASWLGLVPSTRAESAPPGAASPKPATLTCGSCSWRHPGTTPAPRKSGSARFTMRAFPLPYRTMRQSVSSALWKGVAIYLASCASDLWSQTSLQRASWLAGYGRSGA